MGSRKVVSSRDFTAQGKRFKINVVKGEVANVQLVASTASPERVMSAAANGYKGVFSSDMLSPQQTRDLLNDIKATQLRTPCEMVHFTWLVKDVTRAWTHQAVRYRVGCAYVQESMRFYGQHDEYDVLITDTVLIEDQHQRYIAGIEVAIGAYHRMVAEGVASQDARGVLPTNILTNMFWDMSLSNLMHIYNQRWCCQAQWSEWHYVLKQMDTIVSETFPVLKGFLTAPIQRGEECGYGASFDRPCSWRKDQ